MTSTPVPPDHPQTRTTTPNSSASNSPASNNPATLATSTVITLAGTFTWLGWLWALVAIGNAIALGAIAKWGSLDASLWSYAAAGWQRWPVAGAGFSMIQFFLPVFVSHGATRRRLAHSSALTMLAVALAGGLFITAGYVLENVLFQSKGWRQTVGPSDVLVSDLGLPTVLAAHTVILAIYFAAGWLVAIAVFKHSWAMVPLFAAFAIALVITAEYLVMQPIGLTQFGFIDRFPAPGSTVGSAVGFPLIVVILTAVSACLIHWTRSIEVD